MVTLEPLARDAEVAVVYPDVVEDRGEPLDVFERLGEQGPGELLDLLLPDPVRREGCSDGENFWVLFVQRLAGRLSEGFGSGCAQVLRKTYCEIRFRWRLVQSMVGRRCSSAT